MVNWSLFPYLIQIQMQGIPKCHEIPHQEIRFWLLLPRLAWMAFVLWRAASWIPQAVPLNILGSGRGGGERRFGSRGKNGKNWGFGVETNCFFRKLVLMH